ncbi:MAG: hypothetical protein Kow00105_01090 [Phycisphaeraceae bacterium]
MKRIPDDIPDEQLTDFEKEAGDYQRSLRKVPWRPPGKMERGAEHVGRWLLKLFEYFGRFIELPADIKVRRTGRPAPLMRFLCWVSFIFLPTFLWAWLILLAIASASGEEIRK